MIAIVVLIALFVPGLIEGYQSQNNFLRFSSFARFSSVVEITPDVFLGQSRDILLNVFKIPDLSEGVSAATIEFNQPEIINHHVDKAFQKPIANAWWSLRPVSSRSEEDSQSLPGGMYEYLNGMFKLTGSHQKHVNKFKNKLRDSNCFSHLSVHHVDRIMDTLDLSYVAFHNSSTKKQLDLLLDRVAGVGMVLGENNEELDVILGGMLYSVVQSLTPPPHTVNTIQPRHLLTLLGDYFTPQAIQLSRQYLLLPTYKARTYIYTPTQMENQLQMLVVYAQDVRVLNIRLAERVYTMRKLRKLVADENERINVAQEVVSVYVPLADRKNEQRLKSELEDLAFRETNPQMFQRCSLVHAKLFNALEEATQQVNAVKLAVSGQSAGPASPPITLTTRVKGKRQVHLKMLRKGLDTPEEVQDALGLRLVVGDASSVVSEDEETRRIDVCYALLGELGRMEGWQVARVKDYIVQPKDNSYRSLHVYLRHSALNVYVEVQIRTYAMHMHAEHGEAAHWHYKHTLQQPPIPSLRSTLSHYWRSPSQLSAFTAEEVFHHARQELAKKRVFVFATDPSTELSWVLSLPRGATGLDAAFYIHSDIGLSTSKIFINDQPSNFHTPVQNGDRVYIQTSPLPDASPPLRWYAQTHTTKAHTTLRKQFEKGGRRGELLVKGLCKLAYTLCTGKGKVKYVEGDDGLACFLADLLLAPHKVEKRLKGLEISQNNASSAAAALEAGLGDSFISWMQRQVEAEGWAHAKDTYLRPFLVSLSAADQALAEMSWDVLVGKGRDVYGDELLDSAESAAVPVEATGSSVFPAPAFVQRTAPVVRDTHMVM